MSNSAHNPLEHPTEELLGDLVLGGLGAPMRALLESHLAHCSRCRGYLAELSQAGSALVRSMAPYSDEASDEIPLPHIWNSLQQSLGKVGASGLTAANKSSHGDPWLELPIPAGSRAELDLPTGLEWIAIGPAKVALMAAEPENEAQLHLVSTPAGETFPAHRHVGGEALVILQGGLTDTSGHMGLGDFRTYEAETVHAPIMDPQVPCLAMVMTWGGIDFQ